MAARELSESSLRLKNRLSVTPAFAAVADNSMNIVIQKNFKIAYARSY